MSVLLLRANFRRKLFSNKSKKESLKMENFELINAKGQKLFCKYWQPSENPRALLFISHGFGEHSLCYEDFASVFTKEGVLVFSHDHSGHGQSPGKRGQVYSYKQYIDDIFQHIDMVVKKYPDLPVFMAGHSMGGGLAMLAGLQRQEFFKGILLLAPLLTLVPGTVPKILGTITYYIGNYITFIPGDKLDSYDVCSDAELVKKYDADPLNFHGKITSGTGAQLMYMSDEAVKRMSEVHYPYIIQHGDVDKLTNVEGSKLMQEKAASNDKTLTIYPGAFHQVHNEPNGVGEKATKELLQWLLDRI